MKTVFDDCQLFSYSLIVVFCS